MELSTQLLLKSWMLRNR